MLIYNSLPNEILLQIFNFVMPSTKVYLNTYLYNLHHYHIVETIPRNMFDSYIRCMVRNDYIMPFKILLDENYNKWNKQKRYIYKKQQHNSYLKLLKHLCIIHKSIKCKDIIDTYNANINKT